MPDELVDPPYSLYAMNLAEFPTSTTIRVQMRFVLL